MDDHADVGEVGELLVTLQGAERVHHGLLVAVSQDAHAHAVLEVDNRETPFISVHDHSVAGAGGISLAGQVADRHALLNKQDAALGVLTHELHVVLNVRDHDLVDCEVKAIDCVLLSDTLSGRLSAVQLLRREQVCQRAFGGVDAAVVWEGRLERDAARAAHPTMRARRR